MTGADTTGSGDIDWEVFKGLVDTLPKATFDLLLRNVELASDKILSELENPAVDGARACALAHELRGMLINFALAGAASTVQEIERSGGDLARRQELLPRLATEISDGITTITGAAHNAQ